VGLAVAPHSAGYELDTWCNKKKSKKTLWVVIFWCHLEKMRFCLEIDHSMENYMEQGTEFELSKISKDTSFGMMQ